MHFQKQDLTGTHYNWKNDEKHYFDGQPGMRAFDKSNGNQVLFLINFYASLSGRVTLREGRDIEQQIQHDLPKDAKTEIAVFNWIRNTVSC